MARGIDFSLLLLGLPAWRNASHVRAHTGPIKSDEEAVLAALLGHSVVGALVHQGKGGLVGHVTELRLSALTQTVNRECT